MFTFIHHYPRMILRATIGFIHLMAVVVLAAERR
jgi:hypothetical protein